MSRKKTHEEYVLEVNKINPNIEVIGLYIDSKTKIEHRCRIDGHVWPAFSSNILKGHGCSECAKRNLHNMFAKDHNDYVNEVLLINPNIEVVGKYINNNTPILHRCIKHDVEWDATPSHILQGYGCAKCKSEKIYSSKVKDISTYIYEVSNIDKNIDVVGTYVNARTPILHHCKLCGCDWNPTPDNILSGYGCPECRFSKGEKTIKQFLVDNKIDYISQYVFPDCKNFHALPFDFYIPEYNLCIEYDGIQHFEAVDFFGGEEALKKQRHNDSIKTEYCINNEIKLLRIRYDQDIVNVLDELFM